MKYKIGLLFCLLGSPVVAATYYLDSSSGNDSNNGTSTGTPWRTISHLSTNYSAGDTILFKRGEVWFESLTNNLSNVTFADYGTGALPILDGQFSRRKILYMDTAANNTTTRNLHLRACGNGVDTGGSWEISAGTHTISGSFVQSNNIDSGFAAGGNAHMNIINCVGSGCQDECVTLHSTASAFVSGCVFTNNVEGINNSGSAMEMTVQDCIFYDNGDDTGSGGDLGDLGATSSTFRRCQFRGRLDGVGFKFFTGGSSAVSFEYCYFDASDASNQTQPAINANCPINFKNCVFWGGSNTTHGAITVSSTITLTNCIAANWTRFANILSGTFSTDHSILWGIPNTAESAQTANTALVSTNNPLFVSGGDANFQLLTNSPAINAGVALGLTPDLAGNYVMNPPEVGAFEFDRLTFSNKFFGNVTIVGNVIIR